MVFTAQQIAEWVDGIVEGSEVDIFRPAPIEDASEGEITFLANTKYEHYIYQNQPSVVLIQKDYKLKTDFKGTLIRVADVYESIGLLLKKYKSLSTTKTIQISGHAHIHETSIIGSNARIDIGVVIDENVVIGENSTIYPQVYIGQNVHIGDNVIIHPGVKIYDDCRIGSDVIIHANTVIGSDGFGYSQKNDRFEKIPQIGNVIIEDDVEIGSSCTIDRASLGSTIIRKGVKLDNQIQIAHSVEIGENTVIAAQTGVAGSTKIGKNCQIGGQVGIVGHITIADGTMIQAQSGVVSSITEKNTKMYGSPAIKYQNYLKSYIHFKNLPTLAKQIRENKKS